MLSSFSTCTRRHALNHGRLQRAASVLSSTRAPVRLTCPQANGQGDDRTASADFYMTRGSKIKSSCRKWVLGHKNRNGIMKVPGLIQADKTSPRCLMEGSYQGWRDGAMQHFRKKAVSNVDKGSSCSSSSSSSSSQGTYAAIVDGLYHLRKGCSGCSTYQEWFEKIKSLIFKQFRLGATTVVFLMDKPEFKPAPQEMKRRHRRTGRPGNRGLQPSQRTPLILQRAILQCGPGTAQV